MHFSPHVKPFCKREICHYYAISGYHSNELWSIGIYYGLNLCKKSQTSEQSFVAMYRVCSASTDTFLCACVKCNILYRKDGFKLCVLFVADGVKRRSQRRGLERNTAESRGG